MTINWNQLQLRQGKGNFIRFILPLQFPDTAFGPITDHLHEQVLQGGPLRHQSLATEGLLPHIRRHLDLGESTFDATRNLGSFWEITALNFMEQTLPLDGWVCSIRGSDERSKSGIPFSFSSPQIVLFRTGVAFVSIEVRPVRDDPRDWFDLTHFLRFMIPGRERSLTHQELNLTATMRTVMRSIAEILEVPGVTPLQFELTDEADSPTCTEAVRTFGSMELMHYGSIFLDGAESTDEEELRERARSGFHSKQDTFSKGASSDLENTESRLIYQDRQSFEMSLTSSTFVGFQMPESQFTSNNLPAHFREIYLLLFLFVHSQRLALAVLSDQVFDAVARISLTKTAPTLTSQLDDIVELDRRLLEFTGSSYFLQVTQHHHHHSYYTKLRSFIQVQDFFQEVKDEVSSLRFYISSLVQRESDRRANLLQVAVTALTMVFVPAGVLLTLFAAKIPEWPGLRELSPAATALITAGILFATSISVWALRLLTRRRDHR